MPATFDVITLLKRGQAAIRWRLGLPVVAARLQVGTDEAVRDFYNSRVTDCQSLVAPDHYEWPRFHWITSQVAGGRLLEIGCGNGGMTSLLSARVSQIDALDVSEVSLQQLEKLQLPNVKTAAGLLESFSPVSQYDWIVMSEVIEHLRQPAKAIKRCVEWLAPGGSLLVTTPNGHWESDEHYHEFSLPSFSALLADTSAESITVAYLRDGSQCRRWLAGRLNAPEQSPGQDNYNNRAEIARSRRTAKQHS